MSVPNNHPDYLHKVLLRFKKNDIDTWTVDDATKGVSIIGGTGSGKTTASGKLIANKLLAEGWGGLVLCAKADEADLWEQYCKDNNRLNDFIRVKRGGKIQVGDKEVDMVFNPIDYEMKRSGKGAGETQNITNIFMNMHRLSNRVSGDGESGKDERFWDTALKRCLNRIIELIKLAEEDLSYNNITKVISSCNGITAEIITDTLTRLDGKESLSALEKKENYCLKCLVDAFCNAHNEDFTTTEKIYAYNLVEDYFVNTLNNIGEKTKFTITEMALGLAEPFQAGMLHEHFSGATNIFPEWAYEKQKIFVLDFSIKEFLDAGIIAQGLFKLMFQQALERRDVNKYPVPVFLFADEYHYFVNPYDQLFLTTARSSRTATILLSQNISNYFAIMGHDAHAKVDSLMGNLCTKIFHANSDAVTNEYASRLIGMDKEELDTNGESYTAFSLTGTISQGKNTSYHPQVKAKDFTTLKTGGHLNEYKVGAILTVSGKEWSSGKNYFRVSFDQDFSKPKS